MEGILFFVLIWHILYGFIWLKYHGYMGKIRLIGFALQTIKLKENCPQFLSKTDLEFFFTPLKIGDLRSNKITWQSKLQVRF